MPDRPAPKALDAARRLADPDARAAYLEQQLTQVDKPQRLVEPWFAAMHDGTMSPEQVCGKATAIARRFANSPAVLTRIGCELDTRSYDDEAIEVLVLAHAARGRSRQLFEALGRLLVLRGDASGVGHLETAIAIAPDWGPPRTTLAAYLVERDPTRALALLEAVHSDHADELRSMIYAAAGQAERAARELASAFEWFDDDLEAHQQLAEWHLSERRYIRARFHAVALLGRREELTAAHDTDSIDLAIVQAHRLAGGFDTLVPWLRKRCRDDVHPRLAFDIFHGLTSYHPPLDLSLALRAGEVEMRRDPVEAPRWRVRLAGLRAEAADDTATLESLARDGLDDSAIAWIELADQYRCLGYYDAAHASIDRALQLDPSNTEALDTQYTLALAIGDLEALHRVARAIADAEPLWHEGPEHLGRSFARSGDGATAVTYAQRAVDLAPHCHNAWTGLAEAHLVAGDFTRARDAVTRSVALEAPQAGDDISVLRAALAHDEGALEAALGLRYRHLPALPFPAFLEKLRAAARSMP